MALHPQRRADFLPQPPDSLTPRPPIDMPPIQVTGFFYHHLLPKILSASPIPRSRPVHPCLPHAVGHVQTCKNKLSTRPLNLIALTNFPSALPPSQHPLHCKHPSQAQLLTTAFLQRICQQQSFLKQRAHQLMKPHAGDAGTSPVVRKSNSESASTCLPVRQHWISDCRMSRHFRTTHKYALSLTS